MTCQQLAAIAACFGFILGGSVVTIGAIVIGVRMKGKAGPRQ